MGGKCIKDMKPITIINRVDKEKNLSSKKVSTNVSRTKDKSISEIQLDSTKQIVIIVI